ncbi:MAG: 1-acyl-sn-glycerol-3-phosphate acyltransferase [Deltaproteobacteria bacterium]|nr:1-acyl-sn-glycerol-3-phosphate acyltransferase [Deltaproteobacteria bacterium]
MITDILYRCPICSSFDWLDGNTCRSCKAEVEILSRTRIAINGKQESIACWYDKVLAFDLPETQTGVILESKQVKLAIEENSGVYKGCGGMTANHFTRKTFDEGTLTLTPESLIFHGRSETKPVPFDTVMSITIESNTIIVVSKDCGPLFFDFLDESGKKWEDFMQQALRKFHAPKEIFEFYPRIRFIGDRKTKSQSEKKTRELRMPVRKWYRSDFSLFFAIVRKIAKPLIKTLFSVRIEGLENIPDSGSAIMLVNHCSFLDSVILGVFPKRYIWFMAKNSQYKGAVLFWFLRLGRSFPVRRYNTDIQAVRNAIRVVQQGHILGVFPEGERSWDGRMLPFKEGTMRLVLALGKPIIPVGISGAYSLMPRWTSSIKRVPVTIRIGDPMLFEQIPLSQQTSPDIQSVTQTLRKRILSLAGDQL